MAGEQKAQPRQQPLPISTMPPMVALRLTGISREELKDLL
jgi:hypothetical protein